MAVWIALGAAFMPLLSSATALFAAKSAKVKKGASDNAR
jgi:hypothetical protein